MTYGERIAQLFQMSDRVWQRHTNPWSVWSRYSSLPLLVLAGWSRFWWGWWALVPAGLVLLWIWLNPRLFPKPRSTHNWASKGVLGERVWLNQKQVPIPGHHRPVIAVTNLINAVGFVTCLWGIITLALWPTLLGLSWVILGKTWFIDRMVWLFEEMKAHPQYRDWLY
ncbi:hypothetical protein XM38_011790 [Halomicronema hongdechloris C2206]|uniref:Uncharacterized protein n=1 Tax=Halomicronema hongdechloris C2206 TaxID=1641165 RepID=A0A1Z3HIY5_9CYAN|nr:DUF6653 family protein [Halomicronema hongdechloris]ASC70243.1 hypothetical protein XM38_011790 [Halomicronema hongdechloris C2206]